ncbi:beta-lactamase/transpeptidase-like protein [Dothidotthia symphoricarpi CBS 119687]|uniref:Beta-lactamase/transpeptidase-like protein n=1 Tax=Dothidotthia symphoricarpi CBS 119687 TaxID=1392245 RepID=A0A6A6A1Y0_9PLEO|nr:beta-lactamase/transpeptidase-like protein [Dothidotthia symphoricarpi CBS 119687]KAF2124738.1 beta-lactamase/transpeptidase-like protein [Dothidotthia symphoricarpi CBS 119687]
MNETSLYEDAENEITSDSIFRVMSVSKNFAMASALVVSEKSKRDYANSSFAPLSLDTPVRLVLPGFKLPEKDWNDGGSEITLEMLASHTSGLPRESYSTGFNMVLSTGRADATTIGAAWAEASIEDVMDGVGKSNLMFAPGQRAAYSNAGVAVLGSAVAAYYSNLVGLKWTWNDVVTQELLYPLNMTHSFVGAISIDLIPHIAVPGGENWADLVVGLGYDPAAGMFSSANDLAKYIHGVWLQSNPSLISPYHRRRVLKPIYVSPDGKQHVGPGWEINLLAISTRSNLTLPELTKTYSVYGKSGNGGGYQSWIDVVPNLGYGLVVLAQTAGLDEYVSISPSQVYSAAHEILMPAFAEALSGRMGGRFAGYYAGGYDTGITTDQVSHSGRNTTTYAKLEIEDQVLYLRDLVVNGTSALEAVDRLSWTTDAQPQYFSTPSGVVLEPAEGAGETAQFGEGAQVFRMNFPGLDVCDWFDFDGYKDQNGWPLTKIVLVENKDGVFLHYPPFDIVTSRM